MAVNIYLYYPTPNPVRMVPVADDFPVAAGYNSRHFNDLWFAEQQVQGQVPTTYCQKWQYTDTAFFQFHTGGGAGIIYIDIYNEFDDLIEEDVPWDNIYAVPGNVITSGQVYTTQFKIKWADLPSLTDGIYYMVAKCFFDDGPVQIIKRLISEPFQLAEQWKKTVLVEYTHKYNKDGIIFNGLNARPAVRMEGRIARYEKGGANADYQDASYNTVALESNIFDLWELRIGGDYGVPQYIIRMLDRIISFDTVRVDGTQYSLNDNDKGEVTDVDTYPMQQKKLLVRETKPKRSQEWTNASLKIAVLPVAFPYLVMDLNLLAGSTVVNLLNNPPGNYTNGIIVENGTQQGAIPALLAGYTAGVLNGSFSIAGDSLYYTLAAGEYWDSYSNIILTEYFTLTLDAADPVFTFSYLNGGFTVGSNDGAGLPLGGRTEYRVSISSTVTMDILYLSTGSKTLYFFHTNSLESFKVPNDSAKAAITAIGGFMPTNMKVFWLLHGDLAAADFTALAATQYTLQELLIGNCGLTGITQYPFNYFTTPAFGNLLFISFSSNLLSSTEVDNLFVAFVDNAAPGYGGTFETDLQTPLAPPTAGSSGERDFLSLTKSWTVTTD